MIESEYLWPIVFTLAVGTLIIRGSIIALSAKVKISPRVKELFSYIPAAILPAFILPTVFFHHGHVDWLYQKERLFILLLAIVVCMATRSTLATITFGLGTLFIVTQGF